MNTVFLFTILQIYFIYPTKEVSVELKIDSINYVYNNELALYGHFYITNNTKKDIILPKTFDFKLNIKDSSENPVKIKDENVEPVNLINNKRRIKIRPEKTVIIPFIETRLSDYKITKGNSYYISYFLYLKQKYFKIKYISETDDYLIKIPL